MTLIRPLRGWDEGLYENLAAPVEGDREGALQTLLAMETRDDPAYEAASRLAEAYPGRDIEIVLTGPSGARMGKAHNMIEALKKAKHPWVVFSDSDVRPDRGLLAATSEAFAQGADAASALPDATGNPAPTDALVGACFNHYFLIVAALCHRAGLITPMAGGWLACTKGFLERIGGLEAFEDRAAEDIAIALAAKSAGAKAVLLPRLARIRERGGSPAEAIGHALKWAKIIRCSTPWAYLALPAFDPVFLACAALALACWQGRPAAPFAALLAAAAAARSLLALLHDRAVAAAYFPWWLYASLPLLDVLCVAVWLGGLCSSTVTWRGKSYRLKRGGRLEVISP